MKFSKYEFNNKLLSGVTLLRVTIGVILIQLIIFILLLKNTFKKGWRFDQYKIARN